MGFGNRMVARLLLGMWRRHGSRTGRASAITIEVEELRSDHVERVDDFPTPKDMGFRRLEGNLIEGEGLVAHHVRARLIIADEVTVHTVEKLRDEVSWSAPIDGGAIVHNRCVDREGREAQCSHGY